MLYNGEGMNDSNIPFEVKEATQKLITDLHEDLYNELDQLIHPLYIDDQQDLLHLML